MTVVLLPGTVGLLLALVLTPVVRRFAFRIGAVASPSADRWHRREVALLGGVAIALAVLGGVVVLRPVSPGVWVLLGSALVLAGIGLVDDFRPLKPQSKFIAQILVAAGIAGLGLQLRLAPHPVLNLLVTIFWIVAIANAFNLLDNMDGLAAGVAAIAVAFRLAFLLADGDTEAAGFAAAVLGALLGFLVYNFNPASIFMGDAGSLFVGVIVAGLSLVGSWAYSRGTTSVLLLPVLILLVPIFDTAFVMIARALAGRPIATGGRDHPSHRLVALGLSEREAVLVLYMVAATSGSVAALGYRLHLSYIVVLAALLLLGLVLFGAYLGRLQVYSEDTVKLDDSTRFVTLAANFWYKRQVATVVVDFGVIVLAYYAAYLLRFEDAFDAYQPQFIASLPVVIACQLLALALFRAYQGVWRYTSVRDLIRVFQAATVGTVASVAALAATTGLERYSRSLFVLDWLLLVVLASGSRLSFRALSEVIRPRGGGLKRILVYGAGDGGVMVLREVRNNLAWQREIVGFIDDDRTKHKTTVQGVPVLGGVEAVEAVIRNSGISEVIVSSSKVPQERVSALSTLCEPLQVTVMRASLQLE